MVNNWCCSYFVTHICIYVYYIYVYFWQIKIYNSCIYLHESRRYRRICVHIVLKSQARNWGLKNGRLELICAHRACVSLDLNQLETHFVRKLCTESSYYTRHRKLIRVAETCPSVVMGRLVHGDILAGWPRGSLGNNRCTVASNWLFENQHRDEPSRHVCFRFLCNFIAKIERNLWEKEERQSTSGTSNN